MVFFGFALADSMFTTDCTIQRTGVSPEKAMEIIRAGVVPCLNPSHVATIGAMRTRYGIDVNIPDRPPQVSLKNGDSILVMGVRGLPRLTDRHEYTDAEIAGAFFTFTLYTVMP